MIKSRLLSFAAAWALLAPPSAFAASVSEAEIQALKAEIQALKELILQAEAGGISGEELALLRGRGPSIGKPPAEPRPPK